MNLELSDTSGQKPFAFVAKVSVLVTLVSTLAMLVMAALLVQSGEGSYLQQLQSIQLTREKLLPLTMMMGFFLLATAGFITWIIVLYSSFRIAGPLFRFARNIEGVLKSPGFSPIPLRGDDCLQEEARQLSNVISKISSDRKQLVQKLNELSLALQAENPSSGHLEQARNAFDIYCSHVKLK